MMKQFLVLFALTMISWTDKPAWQLYSGKGESVKYSTLVKKCVEADVVLFGELHNNPINHWLQLELAKDLLKHRSDLILGAEFFETDDQIIINEFLKGLLEYRHFETEAKTWPNFKTDYWPLLLLARDNQLSFVATNIPRRYASIVARHGMDSLYRLKESASAFLPPLPIDINEELPGYNALRKMGMHSGMNYMLEAQAIKDATMAYNILQNLSRGHCFLHINGAYHSNNYEGIYWFLKQAKPDIRIVTISCAEQDLISKLADENKGIADFIIVTPSSMTKTH